MTVPTAETSQDAVEMSWRVLAFVTDGLRNAETKAGLTLAVAGVIGGVSLNVSLVRPALPTVVALALGVSGLLTIVSAVCAAVSVWPRLGSGRAPASVIYFEHIARRHADSSSYVDELRPVLADRDLMLDAVASQVWANARVARRKYWWGQVALASLLLSVGFLTVALVGFVARSGA